MFALVDLPDVLGGAVLWPRGEQAALLIDKNANRIERNVACAHELVHAEMPGASEDQVNDEVARRLVPVDELAAMYEVAVTNDLPVEVWQVAEHFDTTDAVAERAMRLFLGRRAA